MDQDKAKLVAAIDAVVPSLSTVSLQAVPLQIKSETELNQAASLIGIKLHTLTSNLELPSIQFSQAEQGEVLALKCCGCINEKSLLDGTAFQWLRKRTGEEEYWPRHQAQTINIFAEIFAAIMKPFSS